MMSMQNQYPSNGYACYARPMNSSSLMQLAPYHEPTIHMPMQEPTIKQENPYCESFEANNMAYSFQNLHDSPSNQTVGSGSPPRSQLQLRQLRQLPQLPPVCYSQEVRSLECLRDVPGMPTVSEFENAINDHILELSPRKRDKTLISKKRYDIIMTCMLDKQNKSVENPQFRFWARKMFERRQVNGNWLLFHDGKPVATREELYEIITSCHSKIKHGGRDKTSKEVRDLYSWIPKEVIARFVKLCPTCKLRRSPEYPPMNLPWPGQCSTGNNYSNAEHIPLQVPVASHVLVPSHVASANTVPVNPHSPQSPHYGSYGPMSTSMNSPMSVPGAMNPIDPGLCYTSSNMGGMHHMNGI